MSTDLSYSKDKLNSTLELLNYNKDKITELNNKISNLDNKIISIGTLKGNYTLTQEEFKEGSAVTQIGSTIAYLSCTDENNNRWDTTIYVLDDTISNDNFYIENNAVKIKKRPLTIGTYYIDISVYNTNEGRYMNRSFIHISFEITKKIDNTIINNDGSSDINKDTDIYQKYLLDRPKDFYPEIPSINENEFYFIYQLNRPTNILGDNNTNNFIIIALNQGYYVINDLIVECLNYPEIVTITTNIDNNISVNCNIEITPNNSMYLLFRVKSPTKDISEITMYANVNGSPNYNLIEFRGNLPKLVNFRITNIVYFALIGKHSIPAISFSTYTRLRYVLELDTSNFTYTSNMFANCYGLIGVCNLNTSNVTSMDGMFTHCYNLLYVPLFNTSNVTSMQDMFNSCYILTEIPLFDTSNVTNMKNMFNSCYILTEIPLMDTSNVTNMNNMFDSCYNLKEIPLFNTSNVTSMQNMFEKCYSLREIPALDVSNVTNMQNCFGYCYSLREIPALNTSKCSEMRNLFGNSGLLTLPNLNTSSLLRVDGAFWNTVFR